MYDNEFDMMMDMFADGFDLDSVLALVDANFGCPDAMVGDLADGLGYIDGYNFS